MKLINEINESAVQKIKEAIEIIGWQIEDEYDNPEGENNATLCTLQTQIDRLEEIIKPEIEL